MSKETVSYILYSLGNNRSLKALMLEHIKQTNKRNREGYTSYSELNITGATHIARAISNQRELLSLDISFIAFKPDEGSALVKAMLRINTLNYLRLCTVNVVVNNASQLANVIRKNKLSSLSLSNEKIHDNALLDLLDGIEKCSSLRALDLRCNQIRNGCVTSLANCLQANCPELKYLLLDGNNIWDKSTFEGMRNLQVSF